MANAPSLLNDDGSASIATLLLMSHHGLRRDLARFALAIGQLRSEDHAQAERLRAEWQRYHETLHGHHSAEDQQLFPSLRSEHPELGAVIDQLSSDHRAIDPLLARGDEAFAALPGVTAAASELLAELSALLEPHLALEEREAVPFLREVKAFPPPGEAELEIYARGFGWSSHGVDADVLAKVDAMLPEQLRQKLSAARAAFEARAVEVFGPMLARASRTAIPDWLAEP
jgi:hemerythrin-like domain-containing protein